MFDIQDQLKKLPAEPGVYLMKDEHDKIIYVGKAISLKNRVRQYFQSSKNHSSKVKSMVKNIKSFEYIITDSELEALILECNLIKKYRPKYNVLLRDDKTYPYIKVTINEDFKFKTLKADDGYIITNTANGFNVDNYIGTKMIIMPLNKNIDNLIAITEKEHNKYMELVEANMDKELTKIRDNNG